MEEWLDYAGRASITGYIRDVQVYNVDSNETQLGQILNGESLYDNTDLLGWWTLDNGGCK